MTGQLDINAAVTSALRINNTTNNETFMRVLYGGVSKSAFGWNSTHGTYMYDYGANQYLNIEGTNSLKFAGNTV